MEIINQVKDVETYVINMRRELHRIAELSGKEYKTHEFIKNEIIKNNLEFDCIEGTGIIAKLKTGKPGPNIALRADIDALPIIENESNLQGKRTCISKNPNVSHLCGHDAHSAMLLGVMKVLKNQKKELIGNLYFCFEEGEECACGIDAMINYLSDKDISTVWGIHVYSALESGKISVDAGPRMSGAAGVEISFIGKGGHGSRPDLSINPVFCAANYLNNLSVAFANQIDANETVTLGITSIKADDSTLAGNIIGNKAQVIGSLRFFNPEIGQKAVDVYKKIAINTAQMHDCQVEFGPRSCVLSNPVINDEEYSTIAKKSLEEILPENSVVSCEKWYGSESFSRYSDKYKSVFCFLGIKNEEYGSGAEHHNEYFDVDENTLTTGVSATIAYVRSIMKYFNSNKI